MLWSQVSIFIHIESLKLKDSDGQLLGEDFTKSLNFLIKAKAKSLKCDTLTFSPIFQTPNKGEPKGILKLQEAIDTYKDVNIIALGGIINDEQIKQIEKTKAYAFASIRYFI